MTDIPPDDEIELDASELIPPPELDPFGDDEPTLRDLRRLCPGCAGEQFRLGEDEQPPASHAQAWRRGPLRNGKPVYEEGGCRGNWTWYWCQRHEDYGHVGALVIVSKPGEGGMLVFFFPDRRIEARPVATDRRRK